MGREPGHSAVWAVTAPREAATCRRRSGAERRMPAARALGHVEPVALGADGGECPRRRPELREDGLGGRRVSASGDACGLETVAGTTAAAAPPAAGRAAGRG